MRYISFITTTNPERVGSPPPELFGAMAALGAEATKAGVLIESGGMTEPGAVRVTDGDVVVDGPYTETKELLGGYAIHEASSEAEVMYWVERFVALHKQHWPAWEGEAIVRGLRPMPMG